MEEYLFSLNNFNKPTIETGNNAIYYLLVRLLLLEKGTIQSHPDMGVGIVSRYRYADTSKWRDLQEDIETQITTYLPSLVGVRAQVNVISDGSIKGFGISITIENILYNFSFNQEDGSLNDIKTRNN